MSINTMITRKIVLSEILHKIIEKGIKVIDDQLTKYINDIKKEKR